ncbi:MULTISPECIES: zinc-binding alcohol dehydrogenase family protein [Intestinimonas]|uniref:Zinc-binding alcohol dehydrogenase family protein n=1 Tax=Intestinimonas massiliensis (ex Afouda et al. 2020) TaxID=1673721 RepID=A0AAW5JNH5_9FIRM|nr:MULTISPECIES: zinc-binding alcohol dehydrogenase family protein [Intestinimonas]MBS6283650.1 zinc-binding alcohol dehydrogenase family protein [Oscillospiraceae bacterium]MCI5562481.1 zinc-binding alcohol dehydrogenase family protein [Intestinimonas massiliensis (ex Afouda et al. 2020)]MCQ4770071.1 zinc-binding alcohol dehydrogenase family protein [Intestinimonas massiliensis (ex Afouda et al. 2020)]MDY5340104.1 zinc-binding alcohol dehydrogenase family protein [Intestinimonas sp.]
MQKKGNKYGTHRVIEPKGVLTQAAYRIDNNMAEIYSNEILVDVTALNIDSASFTQISEACGGDEKKIGEMIMSIVAERGKQQNPVTGSGGMFIGIVNTIGDDLKDEIDLKPGDKIASLVSLSLTPLRIDKILAVHKDIDRVDIVGQAILFESGLYARLPDDLSEKLALAALDVAGAPAQTAKLVQVNNDVLVLGAAGKSGMLVCTEAMKRVGPLGHVVAVVLTQEDADLLKSMKLCTHAIVASATEPIEVLEKALEVNHGHEYDISICCVNIENCEMSCILPVKDGGTCYFFSMATSFTKATLGAEGCGKDVDIMMGNGYTSGHAEIALSELRANPVLRSYFESKYM